MTIIKIELMEETDEVKKQMRIPKDIQFNIAQDIFLN